MPHEESRMTPLADQAQDTLSQILCGRTDLDFRLSWSQIEDRVRRLLKNYNETDGRLAKVSQNGEHFKRTLCSILTDRPNDDSLSWDEIADQVRSLCISQRGHIKGLVTLEALLSLESPVTWGEIHERIKTLLSYQLRLENALEAERHMGMTGLVTQQALNRKLLPPELVPTPPNYQTSWGLFEERVTQLIEERDRLVNQKTELGKQVKTLERLLGSAGTALGLSGVTWAAITPAIQELVNLKGKLEALEQECQGLRDQQAVSQKHQVQLAAGLGCGETSSWGFLISEAARIREKCKELNVLLQEAMGAGKELARENRTLLEDLGKYRTHLRDFFKLPLTIPWIELLPAIFQEVMDLRIKAEQHSSRSATLAEDCDRVVQQLNAEREDENWSDKPVAFTCENCGCLVNIKYLEQDDKRCLHCKLR